MADVIGGLPLPVQEGGQVQGGEAIPVYVTDEAVNPGSVGGPAQPIYAVSDADIAWGKFRVKGGPALPVMISRSATRGVRGGPAIAVRRVAGPATFTGPYTDRYVDFTNGNDANDGTSLAQAWKTLAKVMASGKAGDRILFPGGGSVSLSAKFAVPADGMAFSTYGAGRFVFDGLDLHDCIDGNGHSNLLFTNIEATQGLDFGFAFDGTHDITLVNCSAHDCGNDQVIFSNCQYGLVYGGTFHSAYTRLLDDRMTSGIEVKDACSYITIDGVECYGNAGVASPAHYTAGIAIHAHTGTVLADHVTVVNCNIHDEGLNGFGIRINNDNPAVITARSILIENNTIRGCAYGGVQVNSSAGALFPTRGVTIRGNTIRHNTNRFQVHLINAQDVLITRNALANNNPTQLGQNISVDQSLNVTVVNNTTYSEFDDFNFSILVSGAACGNVVIRNNIIGGASASMMNIYVAAGTGITGMVIDNNLYQYTGAGNRWAWLGVNMNYTTWRTNNANDANSPARSNPLFANPAAFDFTLQAGSPAINAGAILSPWTIGYEGIAPDIGYAERA